VLDVIEGLLDGGPLEIAQPGPDERPVEIEPDHPTAPGDLADRRVGQVPLGPR